MIVVDNLSVHLGGRPVLQDISFQAEAGDFVAVVGPNGGGKSTLLKSILGLVKPSAGRIENTFHGRNDSGIAGYVPQIKTLDRSFPARAIDLVVTAVRRRWPARISQEDGRLAMAALLSVGAEHLAENAIGTLSGGELQRVYLARAILSKPGLLLLDEPETGVDARGTADLYTLLDRYRTEANVCIIMVTHDWEVAFHHATHVLLLNRQQVSFGPPEIALTGEAVRSAFGHIGHKHDMIAGGSDHE